MRFAIVLAALSATPLALADVIPPPPEHTPLQVRLRGLWQEQSCHAPPAQHHSSTCPIRTIVFGDTTISVVTTNYHMGDPDTGATSGSWTETSSDDANAIIRVDNDLSPNWKLTFPENDTFVAAGYDQYPDATFKRVVAP